MTVKAVVKRNTYYDSVTLMTASRVVNQLPGVEVAAVTMGTALNRELLQDSGLATAETEGAGPNDLIVAVRAASEEIADMALAAAEAELAPKAGAVEVGLARPRPRTLTAALRARPETNLALISVPGAFAAVEAEEALRAGRHVFLFSDNVPIEAEVRLKRLAAERGLLLMGPDCGTAIVNGVGVGFANVVRRGPIGVVGASGTGMQQVTCLIDRLGSGISHALGTGGRDLRAEVGGMTMRAGIEALGADPATRVLVLISKPPAPGVARRVLEAAAATGKPTVAVFLGGDDRMPTPSGVTLARTLSEAARRAVALAEGSDAVPDPARLEGDQLAAIERLRAALAPGQRYLRGLFAGGTLCEEALLVLGERLGPIYSNVPLDPRGRLADPIASREHTLLDLGADEFTVGRLHPMIDPSLRNERIRREAADPSVACLLIDVVLGLAAHPDPAGALVPALHAAREQAAAAGRQLAVVVSLCGTEADPQRLSTQAAALRGAGALVVTSNVAAARAAGAIVGGRIDPA